MQVVSRLLRFTTVLSRKLPIPPAEIGVSKLSKRDTVSSMAGTPRDVMCVASNPFEVAFCH